MLVKSLSNEGVLRDRRPADILSYMAADFTTAKIKIVLPCSPSKMFRATTVPARLKLEPFFFCVSLS